MINTLQANGCETRDHEDHHRRDRSLLLTLLAADAQEHRAGVARVGFLATGSLSIPKSAYVFRVFRESLRDLGYVGGQNLVIEYRGVQEAPIISYASRPN